MAEQEDRTTLKRWWNENTTQKLITELRKNYSLYRSGHIRKKTLWQKIADELNQQGAEFTSEQVENKYKSLLRSYRNSCDVKSRLAGKCFKYESELQDIFILDMKSENKNLVENDEDPLEYVMEQDLPDSVEAQNDDDVFEEVLIEEQDMHANYTRRPIPQVHAEPQNDTLFDDEDIVIEEPQQIRTKYVRRQIPKINRVKYRVINRKPKSSVDVLSEIKELMKKVELRNQIRHEQNLKIQIERNKILNRKNELMEQMLRNNLSTL